MPLNPKNNATRARHAVPVLLSFLIHALSIASAPADALQLHTRSEAPAAASNQWIMVEKTVQWDPHKTALVICDMWNQHWCQGATARVAEMAPRMNQVIAEARRRGVFIIHCPSDTMKFYEGTPQRKLAQAAPKATPKTGISGWRGLEKEREPALPIDDSDGGCDESPQCKGGSPWTHQIDALEIKEGDAITDSAEAYNLMEQRGLDNVIIMGVHGNMCVLGRPFSIRQMVHQGKNVLLMRDMTDTMYNSRRSPFVSHFSGTDLVVEHIEKFWCPTITSSDFLGGPAFHFRADQRRHVVFIIGENEYHTWETLPEFARQELELRGVRYSFVDATPQLTDNEFGNLAAIAEADLICLSVRRRTPSRQMMTLLRNHLNAGKPLVGIRTASHAFGAQPPDNQHEAWNNFDVDVLGCHYEGHYENVKPGGSRTAIRLALPADSHPVIAGLPNQEFLLDSSLYRSRNPAPTVTTLLTGHRESQSEQEPVAWVNTAKNRRVFYTSLGAPDDFKQPFFRKLLLNAMFWAMDHPVPAVATSASASAK